MKTEAEVRHELVRIRALLKKMRKDGADDTDMMYGAQQALGWILGELRSPSELEAVIQQAAALEFK